MAEPTTSARSHAAMAIFAENPKKPNGRRRIVIAARLREIASGGDTEFDASSAEAGSP